MTVVRLNGFPAEFPAGADVAAAVARVAGVATPRGVAVAVNGEVVPRGEWSRTPLRDGDRLEILSASQGG